MVSTYTRGLRGEASSCMLRYVARFIIALAFGLLHGAVYAIWHFIYSLLCLLRRTVDVFMVGGALMIPIAFASFVKPEIAPGMPYWVILLMAIIFCAISMGYSKFVDWFAPPDAEDPANRYKRADWH